MHEEHVIPDRINVLILCRGERAVGRIRRATRCSTRVRDVYSMHMCLFVYSNSGVKQRRLLCLHRSSSSSRRRRRRNLRRCRCLVAYHVSSSPECFLFYQLQR